MNKNLLLSLLLAGAATATQADEARLLRFPATNGQEVVFSYAGDLWPVVKPNDSPRTSVMKCLPVFLQMVRTLLLPANTMVIPKYSSCRKMVVNLLA